MSGGTPGWVGFVGDVAVELGQGVIGEGLKGPFAKKVIGRNVPIGRLYITARYTLLENAGVLKYFEMERPGSYLVGKANPFVSKGRLARLADSYYELSSRKYFSLRGASAAEDLFDEAYVINELVEDSAGKWLIREVGIPFFVDFGFQLSEDWSNPRLPLEYKLGRAGVSGVVGVVGGFLALGVAYIIVWGTPPGWVVLVVGIPVSIIFENPVSGWINRDLFPEQPLNLRPLQ